MGDDAGGWVRRHRAQLVAAGGAVALVCAVGVGIFSAVLRAETPTGSVPEAESPQPELPTDAELQDWIDELPVGAPPLVPYAQDGVLFVDGVEIETPFPVHTIEVAGDTLMIGNEPSTSKAPTAWALVRDGRVESIPAPGSWYPQLSTDGRIAFWQINPTHNTTQFVMWDTVTNRELSTQTVAGRFDGAHRLHVIGVDSAGIALWVDEGSETPVMRWDVRANIVEATNIPYDPAKTLGDQAAPLSEVWGGLEDAYLSPDGARTVFTGAGPGESAGCCEAHLQVRPVGPSATAGSSDVTVLRLPDGIPGMRLWDPYSDRGTWGVWWESNETILLDAVVAEHSHLVRCYATSGECERVFDLGANTSRGRLYMPDWERQWAFARAPLTG